VSVPSVEQLRRHPELGVLAALAGQLELVPSALASVHRAGDTHALADQARALAKVSRVLADQVHAYVGMTETEVGGQRKT
jgi:anti-sigma factor ChrR (cupin superfamily)